MSEAFFIELRVSHGICALYENQYSSVCGS